MELVDTVTPIVAVFLRVSAVPRSCRGLCPWGSDSFPGTTSFLRGRHSRVAGLDRDLTRIWYVATSWATFDVFAGAIRYLSWLLQVAH